MRKSMKVFQATAAVSLLAMTLAACGSNGEANDANVSASAPASEVNKPTLKRLGIYSTEDMNAHPVAKFLEDKTGYKVQYDTLPKDKAPEKLNLLMASGEDYDTVQYYADTAALALYSDYAHQGALTDLTPLIDKYGPNIKKAISQQSLDAVKIDGKVYALPSIQSYKIGSSILIRKDWVEKVGMQMPTTTEELKAVLKAFKDKDPGGHGDQDVPLTISGDKAMLDDIVGAFGLASAWNDVEGKLVPRALDPSFKDYVTYVSDLYKGGLLDNQFVVNKAATTMEKFTSGKAGAMIAHWADIPKINEALQKTDPNAKFEFLGALKGPNGEAGLSANTGFDRLTFIPKASKHPEDAIKWINATLDPVTFKGLSIGEEGKHYKVENGAYMPILPIFNDERAPANNYMSGMDEANYPQYWQARVRKDPALFQQFDLLNNKQPDAVKIANPLGLAPYLPNYSKNNGPLEAMVSEYTIKLIAGAEQLSGIADFQAKYKAAGAEDSMKEVNDWYAKTKK
ncbi:extracellular solute-binding protein [Paenibacillus oryzisoli]|uniref:extracellular solute-binding protein n=1 Tax=Paenibacillus oryzisoli TaxID=1850517 RepID=UPI003D2CC657